MVIATFNLGKQVHTLKNGASLEYIIPYNCNIVLNYGIRHYTF
jgi:hypothetical protein